MKRTDGLQDYSAEELAAELAERHCDHDSGDVQYCVKIETETKIVATYLIHQYCRVYDELVYPESARDTTVDTEGRAEGGDDAGDAE